jgi:quercetin dioxygenase-like cupin family protein
VPEPAVIAPGGGEIAGDAPGRRVEILAEDDALHATLTRFGPRREGADLHVHRRHTDLFYVLAGVLTVRLGPAGDPVAAPAGTLVRVPPLVVHGFRNAGDGELRYLNFHAPGVGFAGYLRALAEGRTLVYDQEPPPADGGRPVSEAQFSSGSGPLADAPEIAVAEEHGAAAERTEAEWLYVLEGELALTAGGRERRLPAGAWAKVPAGLRRAGSGPAPLRVLRVRAPNR